MVLAAAAIFAASFLAAPERGWIARRLRAARLEREWTKGRVLDRCLREADAAADAGFTRQEVEAAAAGDRRGGSRATSRAWDSLVHEGTLAPAAGGDRWRLTPDGAAAARERRRRLEVWDRAFDRAPDDVRAGLTIDLPAPESVLGAADD